MATTRPGQTGIGVEPYAGFAPKSPATSPKGAGQFTRLITIGIGGRKVTFISKGKKGAGPFTRLLNIGIGGKRVTFTPKSPASSTPHEGEFTRLLTYAIGGKRVTFTAKTPGGGGSTHEGEFTRLLVFGIGGRRVSFVAKSPAKTDSTSGGAKHTREQLEALDRFGRIQMGLPLKEPETTTLPTAEIDILEPVQVLETIGLDEIRPTDEIGLILALFQAHEN